MQLHKKWNVIQQPSCKKSVQAAYKIAVEKMMWNPKWRPRNGCDGRLMAKQQLRWIYLCHIGTKFTWNIVIIIFAISVSSQPLLGHHFGFQHSWSPMVFFFRDGMWDDCLWNWSKVCSCEINIGFFSISVDRRIKKHCGWKRWGLGKISNVLVSFAIIVISMMCSEVFEDIWYDAMMFDLDTNS